MSHLAGLMKEFVHNGQGPLVTSGEYVARIRAYALADLLARPEAALVTYPPTLTIAVR
jgi:hypothetical protein